MRDFFFINEMQPSKWYNYKYYFDTSDHLVGDLNGNIGFVSKAGNYDGTIIDNVQVCEGHILPDCVDGDYLGDDNECKRCGEGCGKCQDSTGICEECMSDNSFVDQVS